MTPSSPFFRYQRILILMTLLIGGCYTALRGTSFADQGKEAYLAGNLDKAIYWLEKSLANNENPIQVQIYLTNAYILKAQRCLQKGQLEDARDLLNKAAQLNPDKAEIQYLLDKTQRSIKTKRLYLAGNQSYKAGNLLDAVKNWRAALKLKPNDRSVLDALKKTRSETTSLSKKYYKKGLGHFAAGEYEEAVLAWKDVLLLEPDHPTAQKDIEKATRELEGLKKRGL